MSSSTGFHRDWDLSVTGVELPKGPIYFCSEKCRRNLFDSREKKEETSQYENLAVLFSRHFPLSILFAFTSHDPGDRPQSSVKNAMDLYRLENELSRRIPSGTRFVRNFGFFPDNSQHLERGFLLIAPEELAKTTEAFVNKLCIEFGQMGYFRFYSKQNTGPVQDLVSIKSPGADTTSLLFSVPPPPLHPVFAGPTHNTVYPDITKLQRILKEMKELELDGVDELLAVASAHSIPLEGEVKVLKSKNPVIVVEGLDATGKTTLSKELAASLGGTLLETPPKCLAYLRSTFDGHPPLVRRAFYSLGNYIAAKEFVEKSKSGPVVVDRFWHSSAAYAIASDVGCGDASTIPPAGHSVYQWPRDLLVPDCCVLLVVSPEERQRRLKARGQPPTKEEAALEKDRLFEERLTESYKRMKDPHLEVVDASGTPDLVLQSAVRLVRTRLGL